MRPDPLDADRLDAIAAEHQPNAPQSAEDIYALCVGCGLPWPCDVLALVAAARERDDLWTDIHGCQCPAPYDQCPHDEPFLLIEKRLRVECDALRVDLAAAEADAALCRERLGDERERRRCPTDDPTRNVINDLDAIEALPFEMLSGPEAGEVIRDSLIAEIRWLRADQHAERDARIAAEIRADEWYRNAHEALDRFRETTAELDGALSERDALQRNFDTLVAVNEGLAAERDAALASPEGVVTLNGKRWRVVRFTSDSGGKDARLVPYQPEDPKHG